MKSRYVVNLGGVSMASLDDRLLILDVSNPPIEKQDRTNSSANLNGYDVTETSYVRQTVTVTFELHIYDIAERNEVCQKVNAWAQDGGSLYINDRPDQRLTVVCDQFASIESARNWTDPLTIVFSTSANPFWWSSKASTLTITGKKPSGTLKVDGNTGNALVSVTATAKAAVTAVQVTVGSTSVKVTGISLATGKKLTITYLRGRYLRILADGKSVMANLDPNGSTDNLSAKCGASTAVSASASNSMTFEFTARGCWL